jgi:predicted RNA-binding protein with PIN domain
MPPRIIIDGYNLIRQSPDLRQYDCEEIARGREKLIDMLSSYRALKRCPMTVVFDGWDEGALTEHHSREKGIEIIYSRRGEKADEVIKRLVSQARDAVIVVTSDGEIAHFCRGRRCEVVPSPLFKEKVAFARYADQKGCLENEWPMPPRTTRKKGPSKKLPKSKRRQLESLKKL